MCQRVRAFLLGLDVHLNWGNKRSSGQSHKSVDTVKNCSRQFFRTLVKACRIRVVANVVQSSSRVCYCGWCLQSVVTCTIAMYMSMLTAFWIESGKLKGEVSVALRSHVMSGIKKIVKSGV